VIQGLNMYNNSKIAKAIRVAMMFGAGAAAAISAPTFAADEGVEKVERIEVTGSRIKRTDMEGANPVTIIGQAEIARMSVTNVGDLLTNLTSSAGAAANTQTNNGGDSAVRFSLRGIGEQRTLVLVNGRRYVAGGGGANSSVDLNTIPTSIVKRVEILKDGASSIYGSDAIAGVVNIITRDDFEGFEFKVNYGQTSEGDGAQSGFDLTFGASGDKGNVVVSVGYNEQEDIFMGERAFSEFELRAYDDGSTQQGGSSAPPWNNVDGAPGSAYDPTDPDSKPTADANVSRGPGFGDWKNYNGSTDSYNYNPVNYLQTPSKRTYASMFANYELSDSINAFSEVTYVETRGARLIAPEPLAPLIFFGSPAPYSKDNYYNQTQGPSDVNGDSYVLNDWRRRMLETGGRANERNYKTFRTVVGLEGDLEIGDNSYSWELSYNYGKSDSVEQASGYFNLDRVADAVGPTGWLDGNGDLMAPGAAAGEQLVCLDANGAVIAGCVPLNIFGQPGTDTAISPDMLQYISGNYNTTELGDNRQESIQAIISGNLFDMPAGSVGFAGGYEYRKESGSYTPDSLILQGTTTAGDAVSTAGGYSLDELFLELSIPLLDDLPMAHRLELDVATRYSDYSTFGSNTTTKFGVRWMPVEELMVRATVSEAFRAPSTPELFQGASIGFPEAVDPCASQTSPNANCLSTGVPASGYDAGGVEQIPSRNGGASNWTSYNLTPETADILTVGVVWNPDYIEGFSATVDYWSIQLDNAISTVGTQSRLDGCSERGEYCDTILRFGPGAVEGSIISVSDYTVNVGGIDTDGVDFEARYAFETSVGDWVVQLDGTYLNDYTKEIAGGESIDHTGRFESNHDGFFTELRTNFTVNWSIDDWSATATARYIGGVTETESGWWTEDFDRDVESMTTIDIQGTWQAMDSVALTLGIDNVLDEQPPFVYSAFGGNTDVTTYNVLGAFYYARATVAF
jgi:iron complex outermembrane receptor protein